MFNKKKDYFKGMLEDSEKIIYDLEFKKFTALNEHEVVRKQYDQAQDALTRVKAQLSSNTNTKEEKEIIENEIKLIEVRVTDLKADMEAIQGTIIGSQPTPKLPDGAEGIDNKLKTWVQRREYIKAFITRYC